MAETSMGQMDLIGAPYIQHRVGDADLLNRRQPPGAYSVSATRRLKL